MKAPRDRFLYAPHVTCAPSPHLVKMTARTPRATHTTRAPPAGIIQKLASANVAGASVVQAPASPSIIEGIKGLLNVPTCPPCSAHRKALGNVDLGVDGEMWIVGVNEVSKEPYWVRFPSSISPAVMRAASNQYGDVKKIQMDAGIRTRGRDVGYT